MKVAGQESRKEGKVAISVLDNDCLARIFDNFNCEERASQLALVSKLWNEVERTYYQPLELHLDHLGMQRSKTAWLLRDTTRLQAVKMPLGALLQYETSQRVPASDFWEAAEGLLQHLAAKAPNLRSLDLSLCNFLHSWSCSKVPVSPLLGRLTQLQSLSLRFWEANEDDRALIGHLTKLQNLQVFHLIDFRWAGLDFDPPGMGHPDKLDKYDRTCQQLQKAISELPRLTCLHMMDVECKSLLHHVGFLTNLRELVVKDLRTPENDPPPSGLSRLTRLTKLAYCFTEWLGHQPFDSLPGLVDLTLRSLNKDYLNHLDNYLLSGASALTRLSLYNSQVHDVGSFLPMQALQSIKQLEMTIRATRHMQCVPPIWPTPWANLTSLEINTIWFSMARRKFVYILPPLAGLRAFLSLKTVRQLIFKLTFSTDATDASFRQRVSDALCAFASFSMSLKLQIAVISGHWRKEQQLKNMIERIHDICSDVCHVIPGMHCTCTAPENIAVPYANLGQEQIITRVTFRRPA